MFARGGKLACTLRQIHVYTWLNGFIQGDKRVYMRRQTRLPYTLHLMCTVHMGVHYTYFSETHESHISEGRHIQELQ